MAQGNTKLQAKASTSRHAAKAAAAPKKGKRFIAPKVRLACNKYFFSSFQTQNAHRKPFSSSRQLCTRCVCCFANVYSSHLFTESHCENQQVDRTDDGLRRLEWETHDNEECRTRSVSSALVTRPCLTVNPPALPQRTLGRESDASIPSANFPPLALDRYATPHGVSCVFTHSLGRMEFPALGAFTRRCRYALQLSHASSGSPSVINR